MGEYSIDVEQSNYGSTPKVLRSNVCMQMQLDLGCVSLLSSSPKTQVCVSMFSSG